MALRSVTLRFGDIPQFVVLVVSLRRGLISDAVDVG